MSILSIILFIEKQKQQQKKINKLKKIVLNRLKFKRIVFDIYPRFANVINNTTIINIFNSDNSNIVYINT